MTDIAIVNLVVTNLPRVLANFKAVCNNSDNRYEASRVTRGELSISIKVGRRKLPGQIGMRVEILADDSTVQSAARYDNYPAIINALKGVLRGETLLEEIEERDGAVGAAIPMPGWRPASSRVQGVRR